MNNMPPDDRHERLQPASATTTSRGPRRTWTRRRVALHEDAPRSPPSPPPAWKTTTVATAASTRRSFATRRLRGALPRGRPPPLEPPARARHRRTSGGTRGASPSANLSQTRSRRRFSWGSSPLVTGRRPRCRRIDSPPPPSPPPPRTLLVLGLASPPVRPNALSFTWSRAILRASAALSSARRAAEAVFAARSRRLAIAARFPGPHGVLEGLAGRPVRPLRHVRSLSDARLIDPQGRERLRAASSPAGASSIWPRCESRRRSSFSLAPTCEQSVTMSSDIGASRVDRRRVQLAARAPLPTLVPTGSGAPTDRDLLAPVREQLPPRGLDVAELRDPLHGRSQRRPEWSIPVAHRGGRRPLNPCSRRAQRYRRGLLQRNFACAAIFFLARTLPSGPAWTVS